MNCCNDVDVLKSWYEGTFQFHNLLSNVCLMEEKYSQLLSTEIEWSSIEEWKSICVHECSDSMGRVHQGWVVGYEPHRKKQKIVETPYPLFRTSNHDVDIEHYPSRSVFLFQKGPRNADKEVKMMMGQPQCYYVRHYVFKSVIRTRVPPLFICYKSEGCKAKYKHNCKENLLISMQSSHPYYGYCFETRGGGCTFNENQESRVFVTYFKYPEL